MQASRAVRSAEYSVAARKTAMARSGQVSQCSKTNIRDMQRPADAAGKDLLEAKAEVPSQVKPSHL